MEHYRLDLTLGSEPEADHSLMDQLATLTANAIISLKRVDETIEVTAPRDDKLMLLWSTPFLLSDATLRLAERAVDNLAYEIAELQHGCTYSLTRFQREVQLLIGFGNAEGFRTYW